MSETQTESETGAAPYRTPWTIHSVGRKDGALTVCTGDGGPAFGVAYVPNENDELTGEQQRLHARLIAAAGTAAQEARGMGYDPQEAVEALTKGLQAARKAIIDLQEEHTSGEPEDSAETSAQAASHRLKVFMAEAGADEPMIPGDASVALASAEGSEK